MLYLKFPIPLEVLSSILDIQKGYHRHNNYEYTIRLVARVQKQPFLRQAMEPHEYVPISDIDCLYKGEIPPPI